MYFLRSLSLLGVKNKDIGAAWQMLLTKVKIITSATQTTFSISTGKESV